MSEALSFFKHETIREQREARGLSVREVARALNLTPSYLSGIECGQFMPSLHRLLKIQAFFENSLGDYFREPSSNSLIDA